MFGEKRYEFTNFRVKYYLGKIPVNGNRLSY